MLHHSPEFFKRLFETLDNNSVLMRVENDGTYFPIWCSDEFCKMMEGTADDFIKAENGGTMNTVHPDDRAAVAYLFKNHVAPDGTNSLTIRKTTLKNHELYVCIHYAFIEDAGVQYAYCSYFDVSDLKVSQIRTEVMYKELNRELDALADESLAALRSNLTKGVVESVKGTELYDCDKVGVPIEELFNTRLANMPIASDRENYLKTFDLETLRQKYYRGEGVTSLVIFSRRQSGRQCFIKYSASMRKDPVTGDVIVLGIETEYNNQRVTEVLTNKVLSKQYDMVCYIVNGNYGVVIGDEANIKKGSIFPHERNGNYESYLENRVYPVIAGTSSERAAIHDALRPERIKKELDTNDSYAVDVACAIDGEVFNKRFMFYVVDREADFYLLLKSDTTELIRKQQEQNKRLSDALAEAKYANEAKSTFLSNMSHDIRTPMNAIIGFTTLALQSQKSPEKISEYLGKIQVSSNHLLSLINDVLEMSRIESGKIELDEQPCNLPEILHDLNTIIIAQVESKQQELHMDALNVTDENILCDRLRLNQVLLNLLSNAVKYTPNGGKISVRIAQVGEASESSPSERRALYEIHVKDNGIGMSPAFAEHVFEAFEREKTSTVSGIQGTGLGMAITKKIVDLMGGTIRVETSPGKGSEFIVRVSFRLSGEKKARPKIVELHNIHALVVDDDFDTCDSTTKMLAHMGLRPEWTLSGKEAVLRAKQAKEMGDGYGVFIIDWRLEDLNGIEVARRIREVLGEDTPILLMTAYDWPSIKDEALSAGVNAFCSKPLFMSELHRSLERVIGSAEEDKIEDGVAENEPGAESFEGHRLLLVDDMDVNREIATMLLEMHGFIIEQAVNGKDAVEKVVNADAGYYDCVLMDIQMPVMNGYEAAKAIRSIPDADKAGIPIVAMTANAFDEDRKHAHDSGMNAHIAKPIDEVKVIEVLKTLVG
ncbi:MAG: response regulator [Treponema sp.]|nr:response regulator [Treponema sp.]